jgi:hypothetical protein
MNHHFRCTPRLVSLALALATASVACGHEDDGASAVGSTSLTSAEVVAGAPPADPVTFGNDLVCQMPAGGAVDAMQAAPPPEAPMVMPADVVLGARPSRVAKRAADTGNVDLAASDTSLDEAIKTAVDDGPRQDATQVTTTSAWVPAPGPRTPPANMAAPARVAFANGLPDGYQLERVRMLVDGAPAYDSPIAGAVQLTPGDHAVQVIADYRLKDSLFTYVDGYRVEIQTTEYVPTSGFPIDFVATALPKGGVTTPMSQRATLAWRSFAAH